MYAWAGAMDNAGKDQLLALGNTCRTSIPFLKIWARGVCMRLFVFVYSLVGNPYTLRLPEHSTHYS